MAEPLYVSCLETSKVLGDDNPDTLVAICNAAGFFTEMGDHTKAELLWLECVAGFKQILLGNKKILISQT